MMAEALTILILMHITLVRGADIFVSHAGVDKEDCGTSQNKACKTVGYAINLSQPNDNINIDNEKGPYRVSEKGEFVNISHSLTIRSPWGRAILDCGSGHASMFDIFNSSNNEVKVNLRNIRIHNCIGSDGESSVIKIANAEINIQDSEFVNSAVVLHHRQVGEGLCDKVKVTITRSSFTACGKQSPFLPALVLMGCRDLAVNLQDVNFTYSAILIQAETLLQMTAQNTAFIGQNVLGTSLDVILAQNSSVTVTNSVVSQHNNSQTSAVRIALEKDADFANVHLNNVTFRNNTFSDSVGSAIAVINRFNDKPRPMSIVINQCTFMENSNRKEGGALYIERAQGIKINHCLFENNKASEGGAIYIYNSLGVMFFNTTFTANKANGNKKANYKGVGGAISLTKTDVNINNCTFSGNSAQFRGQAIHASDMSSVIITNTQFLNASQNMGVQSTELFVRQSEPSSTVVLNGNSYRSEGTDNYHGLFNVEATVPIDASSNEVCCPFGQHVEQVMQPQYAMFNDPGTAVYSASCVACPLGMYNRQQQCHDISDDSFKDEPAVCLPCPEYARCTEAGRIIAQHNYWGSPESPGSNDIKFWLCPVGYCNPDYCNDIQCCTGDRTGVLCGQCKQGYNINLATGKCIPSSECKYSSIYSWIYAVIFGIVYAFIITLFVGFSSWPTLKDFRSNDPHVYVDHSVRSSVRDDASTIEGSQAACPIQDDSGSDSFEPSLPVDFHHQFTPLQTNDQSTAQSRHDKLTKAIRSNLIISQPMVLCMVWMLLQLIELTYSPFYSQKDGRYQIINSIMDIISFRPVFAFLENSCSDGTLGSLMKTTLSVVCVVTMLSILVVVASIGNVILKFMERFCGLEVARWRSNFNGFLLQAFMSAMLLGYVPVLYACFQAIHCVQIDEAQEAAVLFINGSIMCRQWWDWLIMAAILVCLAPLSITIWAGLSLLKSRKISCALFVAGLALPLPALLYYVFSDCGTVFHCLFPDYTHLSAMEEDLLELNSPRLQVADTAQYFFTNPFAIKTQHKNQTPTQKGDRNGWFIYLHCRTFLLVLFSALLSQWPVIKSMVIVMVLLLAIAIHTQCKPYGRRAANNIEGCCMGFLLVLAIIGMANSLVYTTGIEPYGYLMEMLRANDWVFVSIIIAVLLLYMGIILLYMIRACVVHRQIMS